MIEEVRSLVFELMNDNNNGHGNDHIKRVNRLALNFSKKEGANEIIVSLASLLHDVDDYKIVGIDKSLEQINAREIMKKVNLNENIQKEVLNIISNMGYSKLLKGIRPTTLEGKIVSDADMCDAIGASGIIRSIVYAVSSKGNGRIFDKEVYPNVNISSLEYNVNDTTHDTDGAVNHFFEKLLKLKDLMLTESGYKEAIARHYLMVNFLEQLFIEEDAPEWKCFLEEYLKRENKRQL